MKIDPFVFLTLYTPFIDITGYYRILQDISHYSRNTHISLNILKYRHINPTGVESVFFMCIRNIYTKAHEDTRIHIPFWGGCLFVYLCSPTRVSKRAQAQTMLRINAWEGKKVDIINVMGRTLYHTEYKRLTGGVFCTQETGWISQILSHLNPFQGPKGVLTSQNRPKTGGHIPLAPRRYCYEQEKR